MDKVCVIMSVYRADNAQYLYEALNSLKKQTYSNVDVYLCKDGLVGQEIENVIEKFLDSELNITVFSNEINLGLAKTLNRLIDEAVKDYSYIVRMDSDDISYPERIENQIKYIKENNLKVCGSYCREFGASYALDEKKVPIEHADIYESSILRCPFIHPTVVFDSSVFKAGLRYPINTSFTEDMALWFLIMESDFRMGNLPEVLLDYRLTEDTVKRRLGYKKGLSEFTLRFRYMRKLNRFSLTNMFYLLLRLPFHVMPVSLVKVMYRYCR